MEEIDLTLRPPMLVKSTYLFVFLLFAFGFANFLQSGERNKIKAIVFDFGGVIVKSDHEKTIDFIARSLQISSNEAREALGRLKKETAHGESEQDFWLIFAEQKGISLPDHWLNHLNEIKFQSLHVIPGMIELVKELQKQGYQTALLSNVKKSHAEIKGKLGYYDLFNPALFSYEIGVSKPNPKAYHHLLDQLKLSPDEVFFIDNKLSNVEAAKSLGMDAIEYVDTEQLIKELKKRDIQVYPTCRQTSSS